MTVNVLHLATLSVKIALLGGLASGQLYLLRRAPASSRSRLCSAALLAVLLVGVIEMLTPPWMVKAPLFALTGGAAARGAATAVQGFDAAGWLMTAWIAGAVVMLLRAMVGRSGLAILRRRAAFVETVQGIEVRMGAVQTPVLCGLARPAVVLPEAAQNWSREQRAMVLTHELTHYRQGDVWANFLAQLVRAVFWFHPVVWLLVSRLSREQELTCDEAVVAAGHSAHDYAAFLLETVRDLKSPEMFACAMAGSGARSLKARFARILDAGPRPVLTRRIVLALASFGLVATALTVVHPVWSQEAARKGGAYRVGNGVLPPKVLNKVDPDYTQEAKDDHVEGTVLLQAIINVNGLADDITVVRSLHPGLDQQAVSALAKWTFQPGTKDGQPVPVWATVEINFRLK